MLYIKGLQINILKKTFFAKQLRTTFTLPKLLQTKLRLSKIKRNKLLTIQACVE